MTDLGPSFHGRFARMQLKYVFAGNIQRSHQEGLRDQHRSKSIDDGQSRRTVIWTSNSKYGNENGHALRSNTTNNTIRASNSLTARSASWRAGVQFPNQDQGASFPNFGVKTLQQIKAARMQESTYADTGAANPNEQQGLFGLSCADGDAGMVKETKEPKPVGVSAILPITINPPDEGRAVPDTNPFPKVDEATVSQSPFNISSALPAEAAKSQSQREPLGQICLPFQSLDNIPSAETLASPDTGKAGRENQIFSGAPNRPKSGATSPEESTVTLIYNGRSVDLKFEKRALHKRLERLFNHDAMDDAHAHAKRQR